MDHPYTTGQRGTGQGWQVLSTDAVAPMERLDFWLDSTNSLFPRTTLHCPTPVGFYGKLSWLQLGEVTVAEIVSTRQDVTRSLVDIRKSEGDWVEVGIQVDGRCAFSQEHNEVLAGPRSIVVYDSLRPYRMRFNEPYRQITMKLPRGALRDRMPAAEQLMGRPIPANLSPGRFFYDFVSRLCEEPPPRDGLLVRRLADHALDLLVTALMGAAPQAAHSRSAGRQIQLGRIKSAIMAQLGDPDLSPASIAAAHRISLRSLYELFEADQLSISGWIQQQRLERICRDLADPLQAGWPVGKIALRHGFKDVSHFSRRFRLHFGLSPSAWRRAAIAA